MIKYIQNLELEIQGNINRHTIDIGSLTLSVDNREYILDVKQSHSSIIINTSGDPVLKINCDLEVDKSAFKDCLYNITKNDLLNSNHNGLKAELYINSEDDFKVNQILLHFNIDNQKGKLKVDEKI